MTQVKIKEHPSTDICIATTLFNSYFVFDSECSLKDIEDMVSTWVNIVYDREIVDAIVDEELENLDDVSAIDIDVYDDYCEEEYISLKDQKYTHLEAMESMDVMRSYMKAYYFPIEIFIILDRLHWTAHQQRFKVNKKEPSIY